MFWAIRRSYRDARDRAVWQKDCRVEQLLSPL